MNIYEKLLAITSEMQTVAKNLEVGIGKNQYKAVGEADVLRAVKELEKKYNVYSYPYSRKVIDSSIMQTKKEYQGQVTEGNQIFMRLETVYRFVNIEKPEEYIDITTYGDGVDTQDKAPGKAMTYGDKYALMKAYKIITGEDPDQNPSPDNVTNLNSNKKENKSKEETINEEELDMLVTEQQAKTVYALMMSKGLEVEKQLQHNYGISNTKDLTRRQYASILNAIKNMPNKK